MAYVGHSPVREFRGFGGAAVASLNSAVFVKSALLAIGAAAAILALSEVGGSAGETVAAAKADRLAAPIAASSVAGGFSVDAQARTTTVERGAVTPLSPDSPFAGKR